MRFIRKTAIGLLVFCGLLVLIESLYFIWVSRQAPDQSKFDGMVVFAGSTQRIQRAYDLAQQGVAPILIISPARKRQIERYERLYGVPGEAEYIIEQKAVTTFTNALYSGRLIRENRLSSVLLLTSDYHMPRSFFMLKLVLLNTDCRIGMYRLDTWKGSVDRVARIKIAYNEMVQLWGSLFEAVLHYFGGSNEWLRNRSSGVTLWLREHTLFYVPCPDC